MRQVVFIQKNEKRWKETESFIKGKVPLTADRLAQLYVEITDDLSYVKTFYPGSNLVDHLNNLAFNLHNKIYRNKREEKNRIVEFWKYEVPMAVYRNRSRFQWALGVFLIAILIGLFSSWKDDEFVRMIMGDTYVNMTLDNIEKGDPMAIYKSAGEGNMFFGIGINNVRVSFLAFAFGILASVFTGFILFSNGIMVGAFLYMFIERGMFGIAFTTIFIHGTLELAAIVIAGAAGIILGNSWLFPGTRSRIDSLKKGARDAVKIIIGLVPVFIVAAFLEAFVTRHYLTLGMTGRVIIILCSAAFILWYFVIYPKMLQATSNHTSK
ncbi:MAG: stage II sporulation protein M [Saprospiraceae bacterium]|nr:stage II sporulation protein M [Saprospiraceae bacterium]